MQGSGYWTPKLKILLIFFLQNFGISMHSGIFIPLQDFNKICRACMLINDACITRWNSDLFKGFESYRGFKMRSLGSPRFSAPLSTRLCSISQTVLAVQEHAWSPQSRCKVWLGSDFACSFGSKKCWVFCLSVRLLNDIPSLSFPFSPYSIPFLIFPSYLFSFLFY